MPFFKFSASDSNGRLISGTLQAESESDVRARLAQQNLKLEWVGTDNKTSQPPPARQQPQPQTRADVRTKPAPSRAPIQHRVVEAASVPKMNILSDPVALQKTPFKHTISPKRAYFLFEQLASMMAAGVGLNVMLARLATSEPRVHVKRALERMIQATGEGKSLADAMAEHPDVFNPDMIGMTRAGEHGGFLPAALRDISMTAFSAYRLSRGFIYVTVLFCLAGVLTPLIRAVQLGSLKSIELQDKAGGSLPPVQTLLSAISPNLKWAIPLGLGIISALLLLHKGWKSRFLRKTRHQVSLIVPLLAGRAKTEAARRFAFAMSGATRAGISPLAAYQLGAESIPNDILREKMTASVRGAHESTPLSALVRQGQLFEPQYEDMIENGELMGDVPGMLSKIADAEGANTERRDTLAGKVLGIAAFLGLAVVITAILVILYRAFLLGLIDTLTKPEP